MFFIKTPWLATEQVQEQFPAAYEALTEQYEPLKFYIDRHGNLHAIARKRGHTILLTWEKTWENPCYSFRQEKGKYNESATNATMRQCVVN